jgi:hypothetical protein
VTQTEEAELMPGDPEIHSPTDPSDQGVQRAFFKILDVAALLANQVMVVLPMIVGQFIALAFRHMVDGGQDPETAIEVDGAIGGGQVHPLVAQAAMHFGDGHGQVMSREHVQYLLSGSCCPQTVTGEGPSDGESGSVHGASFLQTVCNIS